MSKATASVSKLLSFDECVEQRVSAFASLKPKRTGSLLMSLFGDAIAPHGGSVWLGSLINALEPFGVNDRLVRTSVFRLAKDGWLSGHQVGRRSFYSLTESGRRQFQAASKRIYSEPRHDWAGEWTLVILPGTDLVERDLARKRLQWLGFAEFTANVMAHPAPEEGMVTAELESLEIFPQILIMHAKVGEANQDTLREKVQQAWALDDLEQRYSKFLHEFRPAYRAARGRKRLDPKRAFQLRTLLIHEYRKVLLRDPFLPDVLLPNNWDGVAAYQLCRNLYGLIAAPAADYLQAHMESADGPLPPAEPGFKRRFGGSS